MVNHGARALSLLFALSLVAVACGDDDDGGDPTASGGGAGKGSGGSAFGGGAGRGGAASGGAANGGTGGKSTGSGGSNSGGASSGGTTSGGATTTGGAAGEGGGVVGGTSGEGGMGTAGAATGGVGPEGGSSGAGAGGAGEGGTSGAATGGVGGVGGVGGDDAGGGGSGPVADTLDNPSFESGTTGWSVTGTGAAALTVVNNAANAHEGAFYVNLWSDAAYQVTLSQVVSPLPNGSYTFTIWHVGGDHAANSQTVYVKGYDVNDLTATTAVATTWWESPLHSITVGPVAVTSGQLEVGVATDGAATNWSHFDDASLALIP